MPALAVERRENPMTLVGEDQRFRRHTIPAKRGEKLQTLVDRHAEVLLVLTSVGVLMFAADKCGEHRAKCRRAAALVGGPPDSQSVNHSSSLSSDIVSRLKTPSCETAALKRSVCPISQSTAYPP
jgi:hypothetical protein